MYIYIAEWWKIHVRRDKWQLLNIPSWWIRTSLEYVSVGNDIPYNLLGDVQFINPYKNMQKQHSIYGIFQSGLSAIEQYQLPGENLFDMVRRTRGSNYKTEISPANTVRWKLWKLEVSKQHSWEIWHGWQPWPVWFPWDVRFSCETWCWQFLIFRLKRPKVSRALTFWPQVPGSIDSQIGHEQPWKKTSDVIIYIINICYRIMNICDTPSIVP